MNVLMFSYTNFKTFADDWNHGNQSHFLVVNQTLIIYKNIFLELFPSFTQTYFI